MRKRVRIYEAEDDHNVIPRAILEWEGPGWYAGAIGDGCCRIVRLAGGRDFPPIVFEGDGFDTPTWAEAVEDAFGSYRRGRIWRAWDREERRS